MKTKLIKSILTLVFIIFFYPFSVVAEDIHECNNEKSDIFEDQAKIQRKLMFWYGCELSQPCRSNFPQLADHKDFFDSEELKLDRSIPYSNVANATGIVSHGRVEHLESYGSAVLISKCHVLTNAHVVSKEKTDNFDIPTFVSIGKNLCKANNDFLHQNLEGKIIAMGNPKIASLDYAIIRIKEITDVEPVKIYKRSPTLNDALFMVGFPYKSTYSTESKFKYPTANFLRIIDQRPDGSIITSNTSDRAGGSGSPIFVLDKDIHGYPKLSFGSIYRGEGGTSVQADAIFKYIKVHSPTIYQELKSSILSNTCQK